MNSSGNEGVEGKTIFIDNPFGAAKDIYIWEPIFKLLATNHVQLIVRQEVQLLLLQEDSMLITYLVRSLLIQGSRLWLLIITAARRNQNWNTREWITNRLHLIFCNIFVTS
mgnify:CR=1 FL=1